MSQDIPASLPSHMAAPAVARLVSAGLLSPERARIALLAAAPRAELSQCGRRAKLVRPSADAVPSSGLSRAAAAIAARKSLAPLLAARVPWWCLHHAASSKAAPVLRRAEIDELIRQQVAAHLRATNAQGAL